MTTVADCEYTISRYKNLKNKVNTIISGLYSAKNNVSDLNSVIKNKYLVNDGPASVASKAAELQNNISSTHDYLKNTIIPAIDSSINKWNREKARLEREG